MMYGWQTFACWLFIWADFAQDKSRKPTPPMHFAGKGKKVCAGHCRMACVCVLLFVLQCTLSTRTPGQLGAQSARSPDSKVEEGDR